MAVQLYYYVNKNFYLDIVHNLGWNAYPQLHKPTRCFPLLTINKYFFDSVGGHSLHFIAMTSTLPAIMLKIPAIRMTTAAD